MKTKLQRTNNRIWAAIISLAMIIGVISAPQMVISTYAYDSSFEDFKYQYTPGKGVSIIDYTGNDENVVIPKKIKVKGIPYLVKKIGKNAFYDCDSIKSITIPDDVKTIEEKAFYDCDSLESITIPSGVETIERETFYSCDSLESITIPDSVKSIGMRGFHDCGSLTSITMSDSISEIDEEAFGDCNNIEYIHLGNNIYISYSSKENYESLSGSCRYYISFDVNIESDIYTEGRYLSFNNKFVERGKYGHVYLDPLDTPRELLAFNKLLIDDVVVVETDIYDYYSNNYKVSSVEVLNDEGKAIGLSSDNMFFTNKSNYTINVTYEAILPEQSNASSGAEESSNNGGNSSAGASSNNGGNSGAGASSNGGNSGNALDNGAGSAGNASNGVTYSSEWVNGKWYNADGSQTYEPTMSWKSNSVGWWLEDTSGWYPVSQWQKVDGYWYYFNTDGYMASSEWRDGYYLSGSGALDYEPTASWYKDSKGWYFMDTSGWYPYSQWQKINGSWYYFDGSGYMVTSRYIDGYWIGADGVCN